MAAEHRAHDVGQGACLARRRASGAGQSSWGHRGFRAVSLGTRPRRSGTPAAASDQRSRNRMGGAACWPTQGSCCGQGRRAAHARTPPRQSGGGAAHRACRYRRRLAGRARDRGPHGSRRQRVGCFRPSSSRRSRQARQANAERPRRSRCGLRLRRARHGKDGRLRAELFQRHRPHRVFRSGGRRARARRGAGAAFRAHHARTGEASPGAYGRRLRVSRRSAASSRSGLDADRDRDRSCTRLLRKPRAELGARRADQGAPVRGRSCGRRTLSARAVALHLAQISRLRCRRRRARDEAADFTPIAATAKSLSRATISSSVAAAFARSSSSSRPSNSLPADATPICVAAGPSPCWLRSPPAAGSTPRCATI